MPKNHSELKGSRLQVMSADYFEDHTVAEHPVKGTYVRMFIPRGFDFEKQGAKLIRDIKSACNLFFSGDVDENS